jgi:hypothetical protein
MRKDKPVCESKEDVSIPFTKKKEKKGLKEPILEKMIQ